MISHNKINSIVNSIIKEHCQHINLEENIDQIKFYINNMLKDPEIYGYLRLIAKYDENLFIHSVNVAILALNIGLFVDLDNQEVYELGIGALLHDVGKTSIPISILNKPGKLKKSEYELIQEHVIHGYNIIKGSGLPEQSKMAVLEHHEKPNGKGYPYGKTDVSLLSKIVSIADSYDAIIAKRTYKEKRKPIEAIKIILGNIDIQFDRHLAIKFSSDISKVVIA